MLRTVAVVIWTLAVLLTLAGCEEGVDVTPADVVGRWVFDPSSLQNAGYNYALKKAEGEGINASDADLERAGAKVAAALQAEGVEYTFAQGGAFSAKGGQKTMNVTGTWTMDGDVVTVVSPDAEGPRPFRVRKGRLTLVPSNPRGREVDLIPAQ